MNACRTETMLQRSLTKNDGIVTISCVTLSLEVPLSYHSQIFSYGGRKLYHVASESPDIDLVLPG